MASPDYKSLYEQIFPLGPLAGGTSAGAQAPSATSFALPPRALDRPNPLPKTSARDSTLSSGTLLLDTRGGGASAPEDIELHDNSRVIEGASTSPANSGRDDAPDDLSDEEDEESEGWEISNDSLDPLIRIACSSESERIAFMYWDRYIANMLPAFDSPDNPYRRLSLYALRSSILLDTILSLATEYMHCHQRASTATVIARHQKALASIHSALDAVLERPSPAQVEVSALNDHGHLSPQQEVLTAILLQVANAVFTGDLGIDTHLNSAVRLFQKLGYLVTPVESFIPRFLVQRFAMLDVTTALLRHRRPHLPLSFWLFAPNDHYDSTMPSFREMTGCTQPVLGFLARIAHLCADLQEGRRETHVIATQASVLETDIQTHAQTVQIRQQSQDASQHGPLQALNECFRLCARLTLCRGVYGDPSHCLRVQHIVQLLIDQINLIPTGCGPDSSLPFPFYLLAKEVLTSQHRSWVVQRNHEWKREYADRSRDGLITLVDKIWPEIDKRKRAAIDLHTDAKIIQIELGQQFCFF